jgi:hypothetical protein
MAVDELIELGWIRIEEVTTSGRPTKRHRINPKADAVEALPSINMMAGHR